MHQRERKVLLTVVMAVCCAAVLAALPACTETRARPPRAWPHPPETQDGNDFAPRSRPYAAPAPLSLPSDEDLQTITVRNRTYHVTRVAARAVEFFRGGPAPELAATAAADAYVFAGHPNSNHGRAYRNLVKGARGSDRQIYLRFDLSGWRKPTCGSAILKVRCVSLGGENDKPVPVKVYCVEDKPWLERKITWNDRPRPVRRLAGAVVQRAGETCAFDVTEYVRSHLAKSRTLTLCLMDDENTGRTVAFASRSLRAGKPLLEIYARPVAAAGRDGERPAPEPLAVYENPNEALCFVGAGGAGLTSRERLVVENCTFLLDFREGDFSTWDAKRCGLFVQGYREVIVRGCKFVSLGRHDDPAHKTNASVTAYDCLKVLVEDCTFEGKTNWMRGHVTVYCCGPTEIRRCEISGVEQDGRWVCGGGIWVATGVGEGKIGWMHAEQPERMLYPAGPLRIEDCTLHDQKGLQNTDGIYVQSIHNFLIRNCKVARWGRDALLDVGFRDTACRFYKGKRLVNHGAVGVVEHCEFAEGYLKNSVGAGGGIVFRNNRMRNVWLLPYVFDGGGWYFVGNEFHDVTGPLVSGYNERTGGWAPREGMFREGSKLHLFNNLIATRPGVSPPALLISTTVKASPLVGTVAADYNVYNLAGRPKLFADDRATGREYATLADWRKATGNDAHSVVGRDSLKAFDGVPADRCPLPGGLKIRFGPVRTGLIGPVGPRRRVGAPEAEAPSRPAAARGSLSPRSAVRGL